MNLNEKITKATTHISQNEGLIFEKSSPGKKAYQLPPLDVPEVDAAELLGKAGARGPGQHARGQRDRRSSATYTRLSTWNYAVDHGMYPLGSCTMKYNPRVNELVARLMGLAEAHPYQPENASQGALRIHEDAAASSCMEITGMDAITLQPAAGAHGELTGILLIRACLEIAGQSAQEDPDSRFRARHQPGDRGHVRLRRSRT